MYESKKTAQMRLNPILPTTRQLAEWERPIDKPVTPKRFANKRRMEKRFVRNTITPTPIIQTLMGMIEHSYLIQAIDKWNGGEN